MKPDELNQFNPDVMLGDQPPEARMNQVDVEKGKNEDSKKSKLLRRE